MRLIEKPDIKNYVPEEVLVLVRHGVDDPALTQDLDQPLVEETKPDIKTLSEELAKLCARAGTDRVVLRHSIRLRAIQTASIIADELRTANIQTETIEAPGVREIYQGNFLIRDHVPGTQYEPLVNAWDAWQQKLDAHELLYRFGDPLLNDSGAMEFPKLKGWFEKFGEHQGDFSLRLYRALREVFADSRGGLQVIVGHQASCSRIQRIISAALQLGGVDYFRSGHFVKFLERKGSRSTIDPACAIALMKPDSSIIVPVLEKEIAYLETIV